MKKLRYEDISWNDFESLVYELLYRESVWKRTAPIGQSGNDGGVDIWAVDKEDTTWYVQCKSYKSIKKSDIKKIVDEIINKQVIAEKSKLLVVVACEVSLEIRKFIESYSKEKGFKECDVWTGMQIQTMLYGKHRDLLVRYFDIDTGNNMNRDRVLQSKKMRKEVEDKLLRHLEWNHNTRMEISKNPSFQFNFSKIAIRSIDDIDGSHGEGKAQEFCPFQLTDVGMELMDCCWIDFRLAVNIETKSWRRLKDDEQLLSNEFDVCAEHIVLVPYYCIVDILENGDDYNDNPVLLCDCMFKNTPFIRGYYKHRRTKVDFLEGKPLDTVSLSLLLDDVERESYNTEHQGTGE